MNIKLIQSLLQEIEKYHKRYSSKFMFKIESIIEDINKEDSYYNKKFLELLYEYLASEKEVVDNNYKIEDYIITYDSVVKLKDGRYIKYQNYFVPDGGHSLEIYDFFDIDELLNSIKEVFPVEETVIVYK